MNEQTKEFIRERFREYYHSTSIQLPVRFERREWGFIFFDESFPDIVMRRHKSFMSARETADYLRTMVPAHVFHSAAYYTYPSAPTMKEKGWQGADLIFDLDADHLPIKWTNYGDMLQRTKEELIKLIGFLMEDFSIAEDDIEIVFSGGRGYHIHVRDSRLIGLESPERREIVDYVKGAIDIKKHFFEMEGGSEEGTNGHKKAYKRFKAKYSDGGWYGRINKSIYDFVDAIRQMPKDKALEVLMCYEGVSEKSAREFFKKVQDEKLVQSIKKGSFDKFSGASNFWRSLVKESIEKESISIETPSIDIGKGTPDEPVTADVKRLIRLPTSLHGGYGFRVTPLTIEELETFNPLNDAIVFGDETIGVNVTKEIDVEIKDSVYVLKRGGKKLPEHLAVFLMCRGAAEYEP
ncbi:MAG: DNA primase catalytic subunit PriS [Methanocellales archaeon]|nr:DNA primase catalytic subunit PriS [Methanocellales archaeon]